MLAVPARIAGCKEIVLCTPPAKNGKVHPAVLFAAKVAGVSKIFKIGGVQAIGSMAYGTESVPKVYKIFGPGNQYVTAAKQRVSLKDVAIDMPAGPSEVEVIADETANPAFVAADLLSQAEHGVDGNPAGVNGCNSCGSDYNMFLGGIFHKLAEESGLTGACFSGKKYASAGMFGEFEKLLIHEVKLVKIKVRQNRS